MCQCFLHAAIIHRMSALRTAHSPGEYYCYSWNNGTLRIVSFLWMWLQLPPASLNLIYSISSHLDFGSYIFFSISSLSFAFFVKVLLSYALLSISEINLPDSTNKRFSSLKSVLRPDLRPCLGKTFKMYKQITQKAMHSPITQFSPWLWKTWISCIIIM